MSSQLTPAERRDIEATLADLRFITANMPMSALAAQRINANIERLQKLLEA